MAEYSFFIDPNENQIGITVDSETFSLDAYNQLDLSDKPSVISLFALLLNNYPEMIDEVRERLVLIEDPEWNIRERLIFVDYDGGEHLIESMFKTDRAGVDIDDELLPNISYRQLFANTVKYTPQEASSADAATADTAESTEPDMALDDSAYLPPGGWRRYLDWRALLLFPQQHPAVSGLSIISILVLAFGLHSYYAKPPTMILPPDKLQQAARIDQQLNELQLAAIQLATEIKHQYILGKKQRREYWKRYRPLAIRYRELSRGGFASGSKLAGIKTIFNDIRQRLKPPGKKRLKSGKKGTKRVKEQPKNSEEQQSPPSHALK